MRLSKHQWLDPFLYPFEMLQHYCLKMYFMLMVTVSCQVVWLCESLLFFKFSPVQLFSFSDVKKKFFKKINKMLFANVSVTASWDLCYSTMLLRGEGTVGRHFGRVFENRFSPAAAAILSTVYFLPVRNAAPEHLLFMSHPFVLYFLFCVFPLPQNSKKGLVAWQVWCERSATPQLLPLEQSCCFVSLRSTFSKHTSQDRQRN